MARLLIDDEWYEAIDGRSWYERDFESVVEAHAHALFPSCHVIPFKIAVESEHGRKVPDLALVDTAYREWSVVEIEMAHHSLRGHVIPQVEVFAQGAYGEEHVQHLTGRLGSPDPAVVADMIKGAQPRVLVVVNQETPSWAEPIRRAGGELLVGRRAGDQKVCTAKILAPIVLLTSASLVKYILMILMLATLRMISFGLAVKKRRLSGNWKRNAVIMRGVRKATARGMTMSVAQRTSRPKLLFRNSSKSFSLPNFRTWFLLTSFLRLQLSRSHSSPCGNGQMSANPTLRQIIPTLLCKDF